MEMEMEMEAMRFTEDELSRIVAEYFI